MAAAADDDDLDTQQPQEPSTAHAKEAAASMRQLTAGDEGGGAVDKDALSKMGSLLASTATKAEAVAVRSEDVDVIVAEFEVTRAIAEAALRQHRGDLAAALRSLLQ